MNPRHRRLLIPGLLVVLVVVVVVSSIARRAEAATLGQEATPSRVVSTIDDPRITESSGLAVSTRHADLAYTINDSGHGPEIFALRVSTGEVVGVTTVTGVTWRDTEAMALDGDGRLWVADTGDNDGVRRDVALYALDEPGEGQHSVGATRYPVQYSDGSQDVESLAIDPTTGRKVLVTKGLLDGQVLTLPEKLSETEPNVPEDTAAASLLLATDAAWSPDGRWLVVRNYLQASTLDTRTWKTVSTVTLPGQEQGETVAFEPAGTSYLIGSEGSRSELLRIGFSAGKQAAPVPTATVAPSSPQGAGTEAEESSALRPSSAEIVTGAGVGVAVLVVLAAATLLWRRSRR
ncbi:hypothetical protein ASD11_12800 [Aeromicrobium sp. Root495]|uniref:hypothetical protein n=1 Tax=Aeromicrobium sp. Root495 TaxID=1736550 RepID=UPI0006F829E6|nr:hypothetical protein [Aeromicrobium sp. Root495]KQY60328.1 hypothetical protein ASD11_12800 [Aeromicrobium sp. Root495]